MIKRIRKAVFPVAGLGTRVLPATKMVPKEMLTVVDRPVLQHCVEEAREAGIDEGRRFRGHGRRLFDGDTTLNVHRRHSAGSDSRIAKLS